LLSVGGFEVVAGQTVVRFGGQLAVGAAAEGPITVRPGAALNNDGGAITCASMNNLGTVESSGGSLTVTGSLSNYGTLRLLGNAQLVVGGGFTNYGVLDIMTWNGALPAGFANNGVVLDRTAVKVDTWAIEGNDFRLTLMGYAGHSYQLQHSDDLRAGSWSNDGAAQPGNQAPLLLTQTNGVTAGRRFYRVQVQ
jgi:hypothetical protein